MKQESKGLQTNEAGQHGKTKIIVTNKPRVSECNKDKGEITSNVVLMTTTYILYSMIRLYIH